MSDVLLSYHVVSACPALSNRGAPRSSEEPAAGSKESPNLRRSTDISDFAKTKIEVRKLVSYGELYHLINCIWLCLCGFSQVFHVEYFARFLQPFLSSNKGRDFNGRWEG